MHEIQHFENDHQLKLIENFQFDD